MLDGQPLQNAACNVFGDLAFAIGKIKAPLHRTLGRVVWHDVRLLHDQALDGLLVPEGEAHVAHLFFDGVRGIVAVERVDTGGFVVDIGDGGLVSIGKPLGQLVPQVLKTAAPPDLVQPPLLVILFGDLPGGKPLLHGCIPGLEAPEIRLDLVGHIVPGLLVHLRDALFQLLQLPVGAGVRLVAHTPLTPSRIASAKAAMMRVSGSSGSSGTVGS